MGSKLEELLKASQAEYQYRVCKVSDLRYEQGFLGERFGCKAFGAEPTPVAPTHEQKVQPRLLLPITCFGKMHYVSLEVFQRDAAKYDELHWKDAWILVDSVHSNQAIYEQWAYPTRFFDWATAGVVEKYNKARDTWNHWVKDIEKAPKPDPAEFHKLVMRLYGVIKKLNGHELEAEKVVAHGLEIDRIREDFRRLMKATDKFRNRAIDSAEQIEAGLETVESTAFRILNVVPTLTFMDPFREAAYKISVLLLRASARGLGGYAAWGTLDAALREAFGIIRREAAPVIVDVIMGPVNRLAGGIGWKALPRHLLVNLVQQLIELVCAIFKVVIDNGGKYITKQQWKDLFLDRLAGFVSGLVGLVVPTNLGDKVVKTIAKSVAEAAISTLILDYENAYKEARNTNRTAIEVMQADLPGIIMRFIQNAVVGVFQRRAQQSREYLEQQRVTRGQGATEGTGGKWAGTNYKEAKKILEETEVGEHFRKGRVSRQAVSAIQAGRRTPVAAFTWREYQAFWRSANLDYSTAQGLRRYADNNNLVVIAADPKESRIQHASTPEARGAKAPKPMDVGCKTSDHSGAPASVYGLVAKPSAGPPGGPTHRDYSKALATWRKAARAAFEKGHMVRADGVLFHPDQLNFWAQLHPEDRAACSATFETLRALRSRGTHDLTRPVRTDATGPVSAERLAAAQALLARVKIGFYSDLDLVEIVDFASGSRRFMGDMADKEKVLDLARDNRKHGNKDLNIHDYWDKELPRDVVRAARMGDAIQHGGNAEVVTLSNKQVVAVKQELDRVHLVFPNGEIVPINEQTLTARGRSYAGMDAETKKTQLDRDIRQAIEAELQLRLGDKYQEFANRATKVRKDYSIVTNKYTKKAGKTPPPVTTAQFVAIQRSLDGVEIIDEKGLGRPVDELDVLNGFRKRLLSTDVWDVATAIGQRANVGMQGKMDATDIWNKHHVWTAVDCFEHEVVGENLVFAILHYKQTLAEAIAALASARAAFGAIPAKLKIWYEIYTAYRPVASGYVRDRLGGPNPGVSAAFSTLAKIVTCFGSPKNEQFHAFATTGFVKTYTPTYGKPEPKGQLTTREGTVTVHDPDFSWEKKGYRRPRPKDPRPIQGLLLTDVWANQQTKELDYRPTKTAEGSRFIVFPEVIACASLFGDEKRAKT